MSTQPSQVESAVAETLQADRREKRQTIQQSFWPRARLLAEILKQRLYDEDVMGTAAALTYKTLFSLLPVAVLALLILSAISPPASATPAAAGATDRLDLVLQNMIFEQLQLNKLPVRDKDGRPATDESGNEVMLSDIITPMIKNAKSAVTSPASGLIAFAILIYGAVSLMLVIENAFNKVYGAARGRPWVRRIALYWCVLTLGPIGVAMSLVLGRQAFEMAAGVANVGWALAPLTFITSFIISWALVLLMFKLIPEAHVQWRSAALGAFIAAFLWELGKSGFGLYTQTALKSSWYGSLVLLPLFMLWIYLTWTFMLGGLQISYIHQHFSLLKRRYFFTKRCSVPMTDLNWILPLGILLYRNFKQGRTTRVDEAAETLVMPNDVTEQFLIGLQSAGIVHHVKRDEYTLARPAEDVTAYDLLIAARSLCAVPPEVATLGREAPATAVAEFEKLEREWAQARTLPKLAGDQ